MSKAAVGLVYVCFCGSGAGEEALAVCVHQSEGAFVTPQTNFQLGQTLGSPSFCEKELFRMGFQLRGRPSLSGDAACMACPVEETMGS